MARRRWHSALRKGLFNDTDIVAVVAPPRSSVEVTGNEVHMFAKHHGSNREDELFPKYHVFWRRYLFFVRTEL